MSGYLPSRLVALRNQPDAAAPMPTLDLILRPTMLDAGPVTDDFSVIWRSDEYGENRVGRIRLATEHNWRDGETWEWAINPPMPVPAWGHGLARSRPMATAAFRRVFERFCSETTARQWHDAFATQRTGRERLEAMKRRD
jgi:hypothetical protein